MSFSTFSLAMFIDFQGHRDARGHVDVHAEKELKIAILLPRDQQRLYEPSAEYFDTLENELPYIEYVQKPSRPLDSTCAVIFVKKIVDIYYPNPNPDVSPC